MDKKIRKLNETNILLVNETISIRRLLKSALESLSIKNITECQNGQDAIETLKTEKIDLVITELVMAGMDGVGLVKNIRQDNNVPNPDIPVVLTTSRSDAFSVPVIRDAGFNELLLMPFTADNIAQCLTYVLNTPRTGSEFSEKAREKPADNKHRTPEPTQSKLSQKDAESLIEQWPVEQDAKKLLDTLLNHYIIQRQIVLKKLNAAKHATLQSIQDVKDQKDEHNREASNEKLNTFNDYEEIWSQTIDKFLSNPVAEDELRKIEHVITNIPPDIKKHYSHVIQQDKDFLALVDSLKKYKYGEAKEIVTKLQGQVNPLSGMTDDDYKERLRSLRQESGREDSGKTDSGGQVPGRTEPAKKKTDDDEEERDEPTIIWDRRIR